MANYGPNQQPAEPENPMGGILNNTGDPNQQTATEQNTTGEVDKQAAKGGDENNKVDPRESDVNDKINVEHQGPAPAVGGEAQPGPIDPDDIAAGLGGGDLPYLGRGGQADPLLDPQYVTTPKVDTGIDAPQREVTKDELASQQLTSLLDSNSKYMRQARQMGLEMGGGLGGSTGIQAAYGAAIKAGAPIAMADAQAYMDAASQNLDVLAQFGLANIQRQTQLELGTMDANTRLQTTAMNNTAQMAISKMQDITNRDIANLDAATQVKVTEMNGIIQARLAQNQFKYSQVLNKELHGYDLKKQRQQHGFDMEQLDTEARLKMEQDAARHGYAMEETALGGEYEIEKQAMVNEANSEIHYMNAYMGAYDGAIDRIADLNGIEMDDNARNRAITAIWDGFEGFTLLLERLYPDAEPIDWG